MEPEGSMPHSQGSPIISILSWINPITRTDTYLFKVHSDIINVQNYKLQNSSYFCKQTSYIVKWFKGFVNIEETKFMETS